MTSDKVDFARINPADPKAHELARDRAKEIWEAAKQLAQQLFGRPYPPAVKFLIRFSTPVILSKAKGRKVTAKEACVRLFKSPAEETGVLCYTFTKRQGYMFFDSDLLAITSIEIPPDNMVDDKKCAAVRQLVRSIHPNAWGDFKQELQNQEAVQRYSRRGLSRVDIRKILPPHIVRGVEEAFQNKSPFHYRHEGEKRNWTVEVKPGDDGILRGWFCSYFKGAAHGSEYILLNPHIASFMERD